MKRMDSQQTEWSSIHPIGVHRIERIKTGIRAIGRPRWPVILIAPGWPVILIAPRWPVELVAGINSFYRFFNDFFNSVP